MTGPRTGDGIDMDMVSTGTAGKYVQKIQGPRTSIPLERGSPKKVFMGLARPEGIAIDRNAPSPMRIKRPGTVAIPLKGGTDDTVRDAKLREAARGFEAIFLRQLLRTMRTTIPGAGPYGNGAAGDIYGDMIENGLAETMSERGNIGVARLLIDRFEHAGVSRTGTAVPLSTAKPDSGSSPDLFSKP